MLDSTAIAAEPERKPIRVTVAGSFEDAKGVEEALMPALASLPLRLLMERVDAVDPFGIVHPPEAFPFAVARIWVDVAKHGTATIYIVDAKWERILIRRVPLPEGLDTVGQEEIATIVHYAAEALVSGATIGVHRSELEGAKPVPVSLEPQPSPSVPRTADASPRTEAHGEAGAGYEVGMLDATRASHGPSIATSLRWNGPLSPSIGLILLHRLPVVVNDERLGVRLSTLGIRGTSMLRWEEAWVAFGFGADFVHVDPRRVGTGAAASSARWSTIPVLRLSGGPAISISPDAELRPALGCDFGLARTRYLVERDGEDVPVFEPWQAQLMLSVEVSARVAEITNDF